jgi:hypothetical protein
MTQNCGMDAVLQQKTFASTATIEQLAPSHRSNPLTDTAQVSTCAQVGASRKACPMKCPVTGGYVGQILVRHGHAGEGISDTHRVWAGVNDRG